MKDFDVLVVGSGSGMSIVEAALNRGMSVALVEAGPLGGTCLNVGCIPSKMVIYPADVINVIEEAGKLGIKAKIEEIDFAFIMERSRRLVEEDRRHMEAGVRHAEGLAFYNDVGEFVSDYTMSVSGEPVKAENVFIVSGARPLIPAIEGLEDARYLTSQTVWDLTERPESIIIVGGGFVAVEFAHFFSSVGTEVTLLSRSPRLLKQAEPEVSELLEEVMSRRMTVVKGVEGVAARNKGSLKEVEAIDGGSGETLTFSAEELFIAAGRRSNADLLKTEKTGVELDDQGFVRVNEYLETSKKRIWAFGDAIGKHMFKHVANYEAGIAWHNFVNQQKVPVDYLAVPYAVFGNPQVASVGMTEGEARARGHDVLIGVYEFRDTAKGAAMGVEEGFVKVVVEDRTYRILGAHIIGPHAPILMQEVITAMNAGDGSVAPIHNSMYIHPALPEVVQKAFFNLHRHAHEHEHRGG
jgi:mycothione reductase